MSHKSFDCHLCYSCVKWWYLQVFFIFFQNFDSLGCQGWAGEADGKWVKNGPKRVKILSDGLNISESYIMWSSFIVLHLWYSCVKWQYLQEFFSFFFKIWFSGIFCLSRSKSKEWCISSFVVDKWKMIVSPGIFFYFLKILIFWVVRRVKRQTMAQNYKKLRPLDFISQEPYMIWSWFLVHKCKRIISPSVLYIISKF